MEPEKNIPLCKQRCFRRVYIFPSLCSGIKYSPAEGNRFPNIIADRKHEAIPETVVNARVAVTLFLQLHKPAFKEFVSTESRVFGPGNQRTPALRRVADLPALCDVHIDSTVLQVGTSVFRGTSTQKILMEPCGGLEMDA